MEKREGDRPAFGQPPAMLLPTVLFCDSADGHPKEEDSCFSLSSLGELRFLEQQKASSTSDSLSPFGSCAKKDRTHHDDLALRTFDHSVRAHGNSLSEIDLHHQDGRVAIDEFVAPIFGLELAADNRSPHGKQQSKLDALSSLSKSICVTGQLARKTPDANSQNSEAADIAKL